VIKNFSIEIFDKVLSFIGFLVLLPIMFGTIFFLFFKKTKPIFYIQKRIGRDMKEFGLIKFSTMQKDSEIIGSKGITLPDDPRVLSYAQNLRKYKINEIPQLINILLGDMSIVGYRPQTKHFFKMYTKEGRREINEHKPGLTGIASLIFRDEEKIFSLVADPVEFDQYILMPYKEKLELWYCRNRSIQNYFKIIFFTSLKVLNKKLSVVKYFKDLPKPPNELERLIRKLS